MKKANDLLNEIILIKEHSADSHNSYTIENHPAAELDDYMKEQYIMILFSVLKESERQETEVLSFIFDIAESMKFEFVPDEIVKYLYVNKKFYDDFIISFRDEEIKYLLGFEMYIIFNKLNDIKTREYINQLISDLEIPENEFEKYEQINDVIINNDLDYYTMKECYIHSSILRCYLSSVDFSYERDIAESNAYPDFPVSEKYIVKKFGEELKRISYFDFVITSEMLDNMTTRFYGIQVRKCSDDEEKKYRYDEYALKSQKVDGNHPVEDAIDIGAVFIFYNHKNSFNAPVIVITHPLDIIEEVEAYIEKEYGGS